MGYEKQTWASGDVITAAKMNHIEDGIAEATKVASIVIDTTDYPYDLTGYIWLCIEETHDDQTYLNVYYNIYSYSSVDITDNAFNFIEVPMFGYSDDYTLCIAFDRNSLYGVDIETDGDIVLSETLGSHWDGTFWNSYFASMFIVNGDGVIKLSYTEPEGGDQESGGSTVAK